jgi:tetratricopeptide (TPR) repeat protein
LSEGKLQEAEACLQSSIASQDEKIQPPALYNLGEIRFLQGEELFKKGPDQRATAVASKNAADNGNSALHAADEALVSEDLDTIVSAYMRGRGARKDLKSARAAVKKALDTYGGVLSKWQRALGDFKSAYELQPSQGDAKTNAQVMDRKIAKLIDLQQMMMQVMQAMGKQRSELKKKMDALKGKMPKDMGNKMSGDNGDDDDDGDEDKPQQQPKPGEEEVSNTGKEMSMTPEEAAHLLGMLKLDTGRKLPLGGDDSDKPKKRSGRDW